eukprot:TRINITY_DN4464_c0_g1_i1.p1 TRINITY_DN4464_c0_g1~~TRINITY_DN4464_c0_g1_i1.p1  ORF type:complete len:251 (+),score=50.35 TRINITY_DN4464_c0_g1_i1:100-852(+)
MSETDDNEKDLGCRKALQRLIVEAARKGLDINVTKEVTVETVKEDEKEESIHKEDGYQSSSDCSDGVSNVSQVSNASSELLSQIQSLWVSATNTARQSVTSVLQEHGNDGRVEMYDLDRDTKMEVLRILKNKREPQQQLVKRQKTDLHSEWVTFLDRSIRENKPLKALRMTFVNGTKSGNKTISLGKTFKAYTEFMDFVLSMDHPGEPVPANAIAEHMCNNSSNPNVTKFTLSDVANLLKKYRKIRGINT